MIGRALVDQRSLAQRVDVTWAWCATSSPSVRLSPERRGSGAKNAGLSPADQRSPPFSVPRLARDGPAVRAKDFDHVAALHFQHPAQHAFPLWRERLADHREQLHEHHRRDVREDRSRPARRAAAARASPSITVTRSATPLRDDVLLGVPDRVGSISIAATRRSPRASPRRSRAPRCPRRDRRRGRPVARRLQQPNDAARRRVLAGAERHPRIDDDRRAGSRPSASHGGATVSAPSRARATPFFHSSVQSTSGDVRRDSTSRAGMRRAATRELVAASIVVAEMRDELVAISCTPCAPDSNSAARRHRRAATSAHARGR